MALVMLDTHVLSWSIKNKASKDQEAKILHAKHLISKLDENGDKVVISTIVLGELLRDVQIEKQMELYKLIQDHFMILPYCNRSALKCAEIAFIHDQEYKKERLKDAHSNTAIKADWMILATALANNVDILYTEDKALQNMASLVNEEIRVREIPEPFQEDIFDPHFSA